MNRDENAAAVTFLREQPCAHHRFAQEWRGHRYVVELPGFAGDPKGSNEGKLEAIQMAWYEEYKDNQ